MNCGIFIFPEDKITTAAKRHPKLYAPNALIYYSIILACVKPEISAKSRKTA